MSHYDTSRSSAGYEVVKAGRICLVKPHSKYVADTSWLIQSRTQVSSDSIMVDLVGPEADVNNVAERIEEAGKLELPTFGSISFEDARQTKQEGGTATPSSSESNSESDS